MLMRKKCLEKQGKQRYNGKRKAVSVRWQAEPGWNKEVSNYSEYSCVMHKYKNFYAEQERHQCMSNAGRRNIGMDEMPAVVCVCTGKALCRIDLDIGKEDACICHANVVG